MHQQKENEGQRKPWWIDCVSLGVLPCGSFFGLKSIQSEVKTMPLVTFLRHCQSTFNANGDPTRNCGLTACGIESAKQIKGEYDVVLCSPLLRARQTLDWSQIKYGSVHFLESLREIRDGNPINLYSLESDNQLHESGDQIIARVNAAKSTILSFSKDGARVLVISHYTFLYALTGRGFSNGGCVEIVIL